MSSSHTSYRMWYVCGVCPRKFRTPRGLKVHQWHHTGVVPARHSAQYGGLPIPPRSPLVTQHSYICTDCGENISSFTSLKAHQNEHVVRPLDPWALFTETKKITTWWEAYSCPDCKSNFILSCDLKHKSGLDSPLCSKCGQCFQSQARLSQHECRGVGAGPEQDATEKKEKRDLAEDSPVVIKEDGLRCTECEGEFQLISDLHKHYMMHARGEL
ncbi:gastrula zinc finger protein XlCGF67.1 [Microcaecilia unicolor]|uniref:Gastrula zinc finger protein XlCGF67.1-like n=1 Tax=Microcaecilia unicolor TaxID=1415580 RepID=A0A6P7YW13_9AMPH|nr:gastrula zinc finger protein XlCGF67.1-like [Microcaecilia unicolor]